MRELSSKSFILQKFINRPNNGVNRPINEVNRPNNSQSKVKYSCKNEDINKDDIHQPRVREEPESYEDIMNDVALEDEVRPMLWQFIKHCSLNGRKLTNDKLTDILLEMDFRQRLSPQEKIEALRTAINGGYYDIKR